MPHKQRSCPDCGEIRSRRKGSRCHRCASVAKTGKPNNTAPPEQRFWRFVQKTDSCWLWTGTTNGHGYGHFTVSGRHAVKRGAHRFAYELMVGSVPRGLDLDHLCRNRLCVNPAHLRPGTDAENVADMVSKGRQRGPAGRMNGNVKIVESDVIAIRACRATQREIAELFGISRAQVGRIQRGERWRCVSLKGA